MELAIALSLQEQSSGSAGSGLNLQSLGLASDVQGVGAVQGQSSSSLETGTLSDTTASGKVILNSFFLFPIISVCCFQCKYVTTIIVMNRIAKKTGEVTQTRYQQFFAE